MTQSRRRSLLEATLNTATGYGQAVVLQVVVYPLFGIRTRLGDDLAIAAIFTAVSVARSYAWRRLFNKLRS